MLEKIGSGDLSHADAELRAAAEKPRKKIKVRHLTPYMMAAPGLPVRTVTLIEAVVVKASHLGDHFFRYLTDNYKSQTFVQRSGDALLLLFRKELSDEIFAALRPADNINTVAYYRNARGEPFDVELERR